MSSLVVENIGSLYYLEEQPAEPLRGTALGSICCVRNAYLLVEGGRVVGWGSMGDAERPTRADVVIDAKGGSVLSGWYDCHTHLVWAGSREGEFVLRAQGATYEEITRKGGGILSSAHQFQQAGEEQILEESMERVEEIVSLGTVAVEVKTGYGLTVEGELKALRVAQKLKALSPIPVVITLLPAHALPREYHGRREAFVKEVVERLLPAATDTAEVSFCDVFCEEGFFTVEEAEKILTAAERYGMKPKLHGNQFHCVGAVELAVRLSAVSIDHLECLTEEEVALLAGSSTVCVVMPTSSFFLRKEYAPARKLIDAGAVVALASDYNPGTSPSGRMNFVWTLAVLYMAMSPEEALNAMTVNSAFAMEMQGGLWRGAPACFVVTRQIPSLAFIPYAFGSDLIEWVVVGGKVVKGGR